MLLLLLLMTMSMMIAIPGTLAHLPCHRFHSRLRCARFDYLCHLLWHLSLHDSRFCLCQGQPQPQSQPRASLLLGSIPCHSPVSRILFGRRLFMAALLNINFIAFALAHLGAALVYSARTVDQTNEQSRQTDKGTDRPKNERVNWTLSLNWWAFIYCVISSLGSFYGLLKEQPAQFVPVALALFDVSLSICKT